MTGGQYTAAGWGSVFSSALLKRLCVGLQHPARVGRETAVLLSRYLAERRLLPGVEIDDQRLPAHAFSSGSNQTFIISPVWKCSAASGFWITISI